MFLRNLSFLFFLTSLLSFTSVAQLSGTYTIGNSPAHDFQSIQSAFDSAMSAGYSGNLVFELDSGLFTEDIYLKGFTQSNSSITLKHSRLKNGNSIVAPLSISGTPLIVDSCTNLFFENIEFNNTNSQNCRTTIIKGNSKDINFKNCTFHGRAVNSTSNDFSLVFSPNSIDNKLAFDSCTFINGSTGIDLNGLLPEDSNKVTHCTFVNSYISAISFVYQKNFIISQNTISTHSTYSEIQGILVENAVPECTISGNTINIYGEGFPLLMNNSYGTYLKHLKIYNNMFHAGGYSLACGIFIESSKYVDAHYNNVLVSKNTTGSAGRAVNIQASSSATSRLYFYNNNFVNYGSGFGFCTFATDSIFADYNNYYTPNGILGYWNGYYSGSLNSWIFATGGNGTHSMFHDPRYYSDNDLHVTSFWVDSAGISIPWVLTDFDGNNRNSSYPDIGADEITIYPYDIGFINIESPRFFCPGSTVNVSGRLKNFGKQSISSAVLSFYINDTLIKTINFSGNIAPNQDTLINFGSRYFGQSNHFSIKIKSRSPNGSNDQNPDNDSSFLQLLPGVTGTITVGNNKDFSTLPDALAYIQEHGLCGPVNIVIDSGRYNGNFIVPQVSGASAFNTITIMGSGDRSVWIVADNTQWYNDYTLNVTGSYYRFENFILESKSTGTGSNLLISGDAKNLVFKNIHFKGGDSVLSMVLISPEDSGISGLLFDSCLFTDGIYGISYTTSSLGNTKLNGITVKHCQFLRQPSMGIRLGKSKNIRIENNLFSTQSTYSGYTAIRLDYSDDTIRIIANKIQVKKSGTGIYLYSNANTQILPALIANNFIFCGGGSAASYGINLTRALNVNIYNNNINLRNNNNYSRALYLAPYTYYINVFNNNLTCGLKGFCIYSSSTANIFTDFNNLYAPDGYTGYWSGTRNSLTDWQLATKMDSNSISVDPYYISNYNLHVQARELDSSGIHLSPVSLDIDGETRNFTYPDIGADEFEIFDHDIALTGLPTLVHKQCEGNIDINFQIINRGYEKTDSLNARIIINHLDTFLPIYAPLEYLEDTIIPAFTFPFYADSQYFLSVTLVQNQDKDTSNNTILMNGLALIPQPVITGYENDTVCFGGRAKLFIEARNAAYFTWIDSSLSKFWINTDTVFTLSNIRESRTFSVIAGSENKPDSIKTAFNDVSGNIANGNMFNIVAKSASLFIDSFDIHTYYANKNMVFVYYKAGSFVGFEGDSNSWIPVDTIEIDGQGNMKRSRVALNKSIIIPKGDTAGIYITTPGFSYLKFSSGTKSFQNDDIEINNGIALDFLFDNSFAIPATWNGNIYYSTGSYCSSAAINVHAEVPDTPNISLPIDTFICSGRKFLLSTYEGTGFHFNWRKWPKGILISDSSYALIDTTGVINLVVKDNCGFSDSSLINIGVKPSPTSKFTIDSSRQCFKANFFSPVNHSSVSAGSLQYFWYISDSLISRKRNPGFSLSKEDSFVLALIAVSESGCTDTSSHSIETQPSPHAGIQVNDTVQCLNENSFTFINSSSITGGSMNYNWVTDQDSGLTNTDLVNYHFTSKGNKTVFLETISDHGCKDSTTVSVVVKPSPTVFLGNDTAICGGSHILLKPGFAFDSYYWSNDSTDAVIRIDSAGIGFDTTLVWVEVSQDGCPARDTILIRFYNCLGIPDRYGNVLFKIFPNPTKSMLTLETKQSIPGTKYEILDETGRLLQRGNINSDWTQIPVYDIPKGVYYLLLTTPGQQKKLIKFIKN